MFVPPAMELSSNQPLPNLRSTLILTHILNLTFTISGNATSSLMTSITNIFVPTDGVTADGTVTSGSLNASSGKPLDVVIVRGRNGKSERSEVESLEIFNKYFTSVIDPIVIATGIVSNALLALVFTITPLRLRPLSHVLSVLSIADLIYISSYLLVYLTKRDVNVYEIPGMCQILNFILTYSKSVEAWYIFLAHLCRLKAHTSSGPEIEKRRVYNTKFANIMIALLVAAPLFHVLWSMETVTVASTTYCVPMRETILVHLTLRKLEVVATVILPLILIAGVDLTLVVKLVMYIGFKDNDNDEDNSSTSNHNYFISSSCPDKTVLVAVQTESCRGEKSTGSNNTTDSNFSDMNKELSLALQIAYHILKETPGTGGCSSDQNSFQNAKVKDLDSKRQIFGGFPKDTSPAAGPPDAVNYSSGLPELQRHFTDQRPSLSLVDTSKLNTPEALSSNSSEHSLIEGNASEVTIPHCDQTNDTTDLVSCSQVLIAKNSTALNRAKQYSITNFNVNSVRKYKFPRDLHLNKHQHMVTYDYNQISTQVTNSQNQSITFSTSHCRSHQYSSNLSIPSSRVKPEVHVLPQDSTACTLTTVLLGVILTMTFLPSTYTHAVRLFLDSPSSPPTAQEVQQAILFESFVKLNAFYKLFLYMLVMPSFRSAIMWLLRHWIPSKLTRMSSMCRPCALRSELIYV